MSRISWSTVNGFRKHHFEPFQCPACGDLPVISEHREAFDRSVKLTANCHGSTERLTVSEAAIRSGDVVSPIGRWMTGLFKSDAIPDVKELLAYNRGRLPT